MPNTFKVFVSCNNYSVSSLLSRNMAFRRTLTRRFLGLSQAPPAPTARRTAYKLAAPSEAPRLLRRPFPAPSEVVREELRERLREINGERWRFDGLLRPDAGARVSEEDAERAVLAARAAAARRRLQAVTRGCVAYKEFVEIVGGSSEVAEMLEGSGDVLAVGNLVFLRPDQVIKAVEKFIPTAFWPERTADDPRWAELAEMEKEKAQIDEKAEAQVRRELWAGLGFLVAQTAGFMRLTFWELSWDVMEPICFYVTSLYFMAGYAFFLRTAREPSFEGFFEARLDARRRRLMKRHKFDGRRFEELRRELDVMTRNH